VAFGARALEADAKPKYINTGDTTLFAKGRQLYNFATARPAGLKAQTIIVAEGYMDVIALVRAGFEASVAPLGTALTEDQLHLLWRVAPEPVLAFDGDEAGLSAAHRAARLALPNLRPGHSLRFAFLPKGEDPDSLIRASGAGAMQKLLDAAEPLSQVLWRAETEGKDFSTPERRAGLERALADIVSLIADGKIADYYRRDFEQLVFDSFKRRQPAQARGPYRGPARGRRFATQPDPVSPAVKNSLLARAGGSRKVKEAELCRLLLQDPQIAHRQGEVLAAMHFSDPLLDRLRQELLNLAASGFRLERGGLENHLARTGMGDLVERLLAPGAQAPASQEGARDEDARFLRAAAQLREMAELAPERSRAVERFKSEATEENWLQAQRLLGIRSEE
jgi:DNA primase